MKPGFALTLSDDGIRLLHRTSRGWMLVGDADLEDVGVEGSLRFLRKTAAALAPEGVASKLVLPNSQILYTEVAAPGPDETARRAQIEAALTEQTPYPVEELAYDWSGTGETVKVAAVTRLTLAEAESFAEDHGFNPLCFVAIPEADQFDGEPFFGQTSGAGAHLPAGTTLERDDETVRITGHATLPKGPVVAAEGGAGADVRPVPEDAAPEALAATDMEAPAVSDVGEDAIPAPSMPDGPVAADMETLAQGHLANDGELVTADAPADEDARAIDAGDHGPADAEPGDDEADEAPLTQASDSSDTADGGIPDPALAATPAATRPDPIPDPRRPVDPIPVAAPEEASWIDLDAPASISPEASGTNAPDPADDVPEAPFTVVDPDESLDDEPLPHPGPALDGAGQDKGGAAGFTSRRKLPFGAMPDDPGHPALRHTAPRLGGVTPAIGVTTPIVVETPDEVGMAHGPGSEAGTPGPGPTLGDALRKRGARKQPAPRPSDMQGDTRAAAPAARIAPAAEAPPPPLRRPAKTATQETEELTIFGARRGAKVGGKPRLLGPVLIGGLIALIGLVGLWSSLSGSNTPTTDPTATVSPDTTQEQSALQPATAPQQPENAAAVATPAVPATDPVQADAAGAASVIKPATEAAGNGSGEALPPTGGSEAAPDAAPATDAAAGGSALPATTGTYASQSQPDTSAADSIAPEAAPDTTEAAALPTDQALLHDTPLAPQPLPLPYGALVKYGTDGLIIPSPEGVQTPSGITLFSGKPPLAPKARPAAISKTAEAAAAAALPAAAPAGTLPAEAPAPYADPKLRGKKPTPRPASLPVTQDQGALTPEPAPPDAAPPAPVDPRHAARQPAARPASILARAAAAAPPDSTTPAVETASAAPITGGTRLAVAQSRRPAERPSDVSKAVQSALAAAVAEPEPEPTPVVVAAPEPTPMPKVNADAAVAEATAVEIDEPEPVAPAPSIPTRASVAKQATYANAIDLGKINLIGIMGSANDRRALIRTSNGRYVRVKVGDRFDGGRVASIGNGQLTYVKGSRTIVLRMLAAG